MRRYHNIYTDVYIPFHVCSNVTCRMSSPTKHRGDCKRVISIHRNSTAETTYLQVQPMELVSCVYSRQGPRRRTIHLSLFRWVLVVLMHRLSHGDRDSSRRWQGSRPSVSSTVRSNGQCVSTPAVLPHLCAVFCRHSHRCRSARLPIDRNRDRCRIIVVVRPRPSLEPFRSYRVVPSGRHRVSGAVLYVSGAVVGDSVAKGQDGRRLRCGRHPRTEGGEEDVFSSFVWVVWLLENGVKSLDRCQSCNLAAGSSPTYRFWMDGWTPGFVSCWKRRWRRG